MSTRLLWALSFVAISTLTTGRAAVFCNPAVAHYIFVGNTATDAKCDFDSIQPAIEAVVCPFTTVVVTDQHSYSAQALTIANKQLAIVGAQGACSTSGLQLCDPVIGCNGPPPPKIVLDGAIPVGTIGIIGQSVITISGNSDVTLTNLEIEGGTAFELGGGVSFSGSGTLALSNLFVHDNVAKTGGGIGFLGSGTLTIAETTISTNQAIPQDPWPDNTDGFGGGVFAGSDGGHVEVILGNDTAIRYNTANDGAGLELDEDAHVVMTAAHSEIHTNTAAWNGGGLRLHHGASADIGSAGVGGAVISDNTANFGGGIAVDTELFDINGTLLRLFTTDAGNPVSIDRNHATGYGGALSTTYKGFSIPIAENPAGTTTVASPFVCLFDFRMRQNDAALEGSALAIDAGTLYINTDPDGVCGMASLPALGAVACAFGTNCNEISANSSPGLGASTLWTDKDIALQATRFSMIGNSGEYAIAAGGSPTLTNCLIAENQTSNELISFVAAQAKLDNCTIANNTIGGDSVFATAGSDLVLSDSIVSQPQRYSWHTYPYGSFPYQVISVLHPSYLLASDLSTLPTDPTLATGDPLFVDSANHDYHLQPNSPAIDFAPASANGSVDFDRQPRTADLANVANHFGPRDLGAYEYQIGGVGDRIFLGTFD